MSLTRHHLVRSLQAGALGAVVVAGVHLAGSVTATGAAGAACQADVASAPQFEAARLASCSQVESTLLALATFEAQAGAAMVAGAGLAAGAAVSLRRRERSSAVPSDGSLGSGAQALPASH